MNLKRHVLSLLVLFKLKKMKRVCYFILLSSTAVLSQVGIGTVTPNATLEIKSSNEATPANTDGLLIPKIEEFPSTAPTAAQDGMLVYVTGAGTEAKGFYFWDNGTTAWVLATGAKNINDLSDGITDGSGSSLFLGTNAGINDDGTDNRNVGIGFNSLSNTTSGIANVALGYWASRDNTTGYGNVALGDYTLRNNSSGFWSIAIGPGSLREQTLGSTNIAIGKSAGDNITIGTNNIFIGQETTLLPNSNNKLMIENSLTNPSPNTALIYGEFDNDILRTNGTFQIGNPAGTGYALPAVDGTLNQVLRTDGSGGASWIDPATVVIHTINDLIDGKSDATGSSIFFGNDAGSMDDGTNNINIGIGFESLMNTVNGVNNVAVGYQSLQSMGTGTGNTALGHRAMRLAVGGSSNIALGQSVLENNLTGSDNVALGTGALRNNASGDYNTAIGSVSLDSNTSGDSNISIGRASMNVNEDGSNNIAFGAYAGYFVEGDDNVFIGENAGGLGNGTGAHAKNGSVFIGSNAGATEIVSNRLYIENSNSSAPLIYGEFDNDIVGINGNLGIGTQAPTVPLHITENGTSGVQTIVAGLASNTSNRPILQFSETANMGLAEGMSLEYDGRGTGDANRMVINNIGGSPLFEFRNGGDMTLTNGDIIVRGAATDREIKLEDDAGNSDRALMRQTGTQDIYVGDIDDNGGNLFMRAGGTDEIAVLAGSGFVGINTLTPAYTLEVNGSAAKPGGGSWTNVSDKRLKQNIKPYTQGLEKLLQIEPVYYQYNETSGFDTSNTHVGVVAQELQKVVPSMVTSYQRGNSVYLAVNNSEMTYMLINAVKAQQEEIELLKNELLQLKLTINAHE